MGGDHDPRDQVGLDPVGPAVTRVGGAAGPPDLDWDDDGRTPPLLERVPWRIGVLDKDLIGDPDAIVEHASWIAGWYVHDCAELLGLVQELPPPEVAVVGPPDLDHAIQAASTALRRQNYFAGSPDFRADVARVAVEAAAPVLLQAMRDRLADLEDTARTVVACLEARNVTTALSLLTNALEAYPPAQEEDRSG